MPNTNIIAPATDRGVNVDPTTPPEFINAGVVVSRDVIEWDGRAYSVRSGKTGPKTRQLVLRDIKTGRARTIRPRRDVRVRLLQDRRANNWM